MKLSDLDNIFNRVKRIRNRLDQKEGGGASWEYTFENDETHRYQTNGIKPPEEIQDDIESAYVWLWSLKDYVKKYSIKAGRDKNWIENRVNSDPNLCICADIANGLKHGGLDRKTRSFKYPKLGEVSYTIPQKAVSSITVLAFEVITNVKDPKLVELSMDVLDKQGRRIGDALKYLDCGIKAWENIIDELDHRA